MDIVRCGHDTLYAAPAAQSAVIFIRCKDGISHNETKDARAEYFGVGGGCVAECDGGADECIEPALNVARGSGSVFQDRVKNSSYRRHFQVLTIRTKGQRNRE